MNKRSFSQKVLHFLNGSGFYIALGLCLAVIGVSGWFLWQDVSTAAEMAAQTSRTETVVVEPKTVTDAEMVEPKHDDDMEKPTAKKLPEEDIEPDDDFDEAEEGHDEETMGEADDVTEPDTPTMEPMEAEEAAETVQPTETVTITETEELEHAHGWLYPLEGAVVSAFSADTLTYNEAMGDWRTHDGIDLSAELGQSVTAACGGTVISVQDDPLMGKTVVMDCGNDVTVTYSNLAQDVAVTAGERLSAGDLIGSVGDTAVGEVCETPWLHFAVAVKGEEVDPQRFLIQ